MDTVLVTGGAGFIGSHLVDALLEQGYAVRVLDDLSTGRTANLDPAKAKHGAQLSFVLGTVCDTVVVEEAMKGVRYVFHQAARSLVPFSVDHPDIAMNINVMGTVHVLKAAHEANVERVVYASSSSIYGDAIPIENGIPVGKGAHEGLAPAPASPYAVSKLAGEHLCRAWTVCYGLATTSLRYFNVYGPRQRLISSNYGLVVPKFLDMLQRDEPPTIYGDGFQTRDWTHVSDVVAANLAALDAPAGSFYNVASGTSYSVRQLAGMLARVLGKRIQPVTLPERTGDVLHTRADLTKVRLEMGWIPTVDLLDGLKALVS